MRKPQIPALSFIKAVCCLGIVAYHFANQMTNVRLSFFLETANCSWGDLLVTVFFVVSGALLYYHNSEKLDLAVYFKKRWLGIFPMFYVAYFYFFIQTVLNIRTPFYKGKPWAYIFTLIGMDGYLSQVTTTYYLLGEWFLGAIIILYILFPLLRELFQRNSTVTALSVLALYLFFADRPITNPNAFWSISSCLLSFTMGLLFIKYRKKLMTPMVFLVSLAGCIFFLFVKLPITANLAAHLSGIFFFVCLVHVGEWVMKPRLLAGFFAELGRLSYPIFLVHHRLLCRFAEAWQPGSPVKAMAILAFSGIVILCMAQALSIVTDAVVRFVGAQMKNRKSKQSATVR